MEIVWILVAFVVSLIIACWVLDRVGPEAYHEAYDKAMQKDLEYAREHPGCSRDEAHRHRDAVNDRFGM